MYISAANTNEIDATVVAPTFYSRSVSYRNNIHDIILMDYVTYPNIKYQTQLKK
jgi:hypothetical protein